MRAYHQSLDYLDSLHPLCEDEKKLLSNICKPIVLPKRTKLVETGDAFDSIFVLTSGLLRWSFYSDCGKESNVFLTSEKDPTTVFGIPEFYENQNITKYTIEAVVDTQLLLFQKDCFEELAFQHRGIYQFYVKSLKTIVDHLRKRTEHFCTHSPSERYGKFLKEKSFVAKNANVSHLATFLGITPNSLSRLTARLHRKNQEDKK